MLRTPISSTIAALMCLALVSPSDADVVTAVTNGFQIKQKVETDLSTREAWDTFVNDFSKWWDASHSYSQNAANLSIDLKQRCMFEKLPNDGFVRHLEIVYSQPGTAIRFTGGLGPLQQMGVSGALTVTFTKTDGKTVVELEYNVSGRNDQGLDKFAAAVDNVITAQLQSFARHSKSKSNGKP